jgi:hypothetical protein
MQLSRSFVAVALVGVLAAACGSSSPTQAPAATQGTQATQDNGGGGGGGGGGATDQPQATKAGGGGGGGSIDTTYGKVHIDISGPVQKSADYGFVPAGSVFGGASGTSLSFSNGGDELVQIIVTSDGQAVVTYGGADFSAPVAACTTSNWNLGATSASGSFDCANATAITASGATITGVSVKGDFTAHT